MSSSVLWGVLAITAFSLVGFALTSAGGWMPRLPERIRAVVAAVGWALYSAFLSYSLYGIFFRPDGLVARVHLPRDAGMAAWILLSLLLAVGALRRVFKSTRSTGTGASA